jgi:cell division FtsZ-interacting protein ZapD
MSNFNEALAAEVARLRQVLTRIIETPGIDVERLKAIARAALKLPGPTT